MSVYQTVTAAKLLSTNAKGADAFYSTGNSAIDVFLYCSKNPNISFDEFCTLYNDFANALQENPEIFLKILNYQRNIKNGNGIKHYYYLGMQIFQNGCKNDNLFKSVIESTYQYSKDLYHFGEAGLKIYANRIILQLLALLQNDSSVKYDPMLFKYLAYEGTLREKELKFIQNELNKENVHYLITVIKNAYNSEFIRPIAKKICDLLYSRLTSDSFDGKLFTNRVMRKFKTIFNSELHLNDYLFVGKHHDGSMFDYKNQDDTIEKIANDIGKTAGIATINICKTIQNWKNSLEKDSFNDCKKILMKGYDKYLENLENKKTKAKVLGVNVEDLAYSYFENNNSIDHVVLESLLNASIEKLQNEWYSNFDDVYTLENFKESFVAILDRSGSMGEHEQIPIKIGCFYLLMMAKIFELKEVIYFENKVTVVSITKEQLNGNILNLLKRVYTHVEGGTYMNKAFRFLEEKKYLDKNVVIFSDGDADPKNGQNPFHAVFNNNKYTYLPTHNYIVMNVNKKKLSFPYLHFHEKVCIINGTSSVVFLIESLIISWKTKAKITPTMILDCCLRRQNIFSQHVLDGLNDVNKYEFSRHVNLDVLYIEWMKSLPKMKNKPVDNGITVYDYDDEDDFEMV
uniref:VWFA domain-containing protein n=1 Tax=viral metagenome TaxID=1070528 RepID=A0A6C0HYK2_9ZZZZ